MVRPLAACSQSEGDHIDSIFDAMSPGDHEQVVFVREPGARYRAIIAVHSTRRGPAIGGTRVWRYAAERDALADALRLSRAMTKKAAAADLPYGGGKAVILEPDGIEDPRIREQLFRAHGRAVDRLAGRYITGPDVGSSEDDMVWVREESRHVSGVHGHSGDPAPYTARGVLRAMLAAAKHRWGHADLGGRTVAVQGCGHVGTALARLLHAEGARLLVTDIDPARTEAVVRRTGATAVPSDAIVDIEADVFAPCALGGVLDAETIARLRVELVVGGANNVLADMRHADALASRGITSVPDYVANAGGLISGAAFLLGWGHDRMDAHIDRIFDTTLELLERAAREGVSPWTAAERLVEERLQEPLTRAE